ncbi:MAG: aspartate/glutamate racemase family protein [Candidatus Aenigmarchaeota archaeon]|nr:aspartate/glutamate racemase family protein [Candidatus Aenigmarchaeota archaeon]
MFTPSDPEQDEVNRIIFGELVLGKIKEDTRRRLLKIIESKGCDGVILGCTELPAILTQEHAKAAGKAFLDTVDIHTHAALDTALSS